MREPSAETMAEHFGFTPSKTGLLGSTFVRHADINGRPYTLLYIEAPLIDDIGEVSRSHTVGLLIRYALGNVNEEDFKYTQVPIPVRYHDFINNPARYVSMIYGE